MTSTSVTATVSVPRPQDTHLGGLFVQVPNPCVYSSPVPGHHHSAVVHWSRWRALVILLLSTLCMSACADLATEHISPILTNSTISQVSVEMVINTVLGDFGVLWIGSPP